MRFALAIAGLSLLAAAGASAEPVKNKPQIALDPTQAYVMCAGAHWGQTLTIVSIPTSADMEAYRRNRSAALEQARRDYAQKLATWQARKPGDTAPQPVEPSDATFAFRLPVVAVTMGAFPGDRFAKTDTRSIYLESLPPGDYYVDGPIFNGPADGVQATCMCLTVRFHVSAGQITDMGRIVSNFYEAKQRARAAGAPPPRSPLDLPDGVTTMAIEPAQPGAPVDPRIGAFPVRPAEYHPFGKFQNTTGELVDRLTEMPGVFRYDGDVMVDLTGGASR